MVYGLESMSEEQKIMERARTRFLAELEQHLEELSTDDVDYATELRRFHTIKGGAGFFGFPELEELASQIVQSCEVHSEATIQLLKDFRELAQAILQGNS
jgi:chemotaxis protein histidine kinase CheA